MSYTVSMRLGPLLLVLLTAVGCQPLPAASGWDPAGENCATNTGPYIGDVQINSEFNSEEETWLLVLGLRWQDPGTQGAGDPGNMLGGEFTYELSGFASEDVELTSLVLESGCAGDPDSEDGTTAFCSLVSVGNACPPGQAAVCQAGGLAVPLVLTPANPDFPVLEGDEIYVSLRTRDACGMTSNTVSGQYAIGTGLMTSNTEPT